MAILFHWLGLVGQAGLERPSDHDALPVGVYLVHARSCVAAAADGDTIANPYLDGAAAW